MLFSSVFAASPNYISPLNLELRGDFIRIKPSTFYRVSQINKIEARVTFNISYDDKDDLVIQSPLLLSSKSGDVLAVNAKSFRDQKSRGVGKPTAKIEFFINEDAYIIANITGKQFSDELYFERTIERARKHFERLLNMTQIKIEQGSAHQSTTRPESKSK